MGQKGPEIVPGVVAGIVARALANKLDVLILDPLGAVHTLPENSNEAANLLSGEMRDIAHQAGIAVIILHHTGKAAATDMDSAGAGASRGASAFVDAARVVRQVIRMSPAEAKRYGIVDKDRRDYMRVENGKANLARAEGGRWLRMVDVRLDNGAGLWPDGDRVGVAERWKPPTTQPGTDADLALVQTAIGAATPPPRNDPKARNWVGYIVAAVLGLGIGTQGANPPPSTPEQAANLARVRDLLAGWLRDGSLICQTARDKDTRHNVKIVTVGKLADESDSDADADPLNALPPSQPDTPGRGDV